MTKLDSLRSANAALVKQPLVAVFVGGTSGIGEYTVKTLARNHGTTGAGLRAYIIGRNADAAAKIIADCRQLAPNGDFIFLQARDLALVEDVNKCCKDLVEREMKSGDGAARIDLLVLTQGSLLFGGREGTRLLKALEVARISTNAL